MKLFLVAVICLEVASALLPAQRQDFSAMDDEALMRQLDELAPLPDKAHKRHGAFTPYPPTTASPTTHNPDLPFQANNPQGCGWRGFGVGYRTVGGVATIFAEFKWTVAIINISNDSYTGVGSLIHPQVVLTVAHHFEAGGSWRVRAGEWSLKHNYEFYEHQARDVAEVVMHPKYDTNTLKYDIALLILSQPLTPGEHVGYLCLPPAQAATPPGSRCIVTGWGHDKFQGGSVQDIMKMIEMPVMEDRVCEQRLRPRVGLGFDLHSTMLCAGGERNLDACTKDGGAPLACPYATAPNRFYQAGIVSWGSGCGAEGVPGVYTNVAALRPWVDELMLARGYGTETYTFQ